MHAFIALPICLVSIMHDILWLMHRIFGLIIAIFWLMHGLNTIIRGIFGLKHGSIDQSYQSLP